MREPFGMSVPMLGRHDDVAHQPSQGLRAAPAEDRFGSAVPGRDLPLVVHSHHRIGRAVEQGLEVLHRHFSHNRFTGRIEDVRFRRNT